jgi:hypothetical protein
LIALVSWPLIAGVSCIVVFLLCGWSQPLLFA